MTLPVRYLPVLAVADPTLKIATMNHSQHENNAFVVDDIEHHAAISGAT